MWTTTVDPGVAAAIVSILSRITGDDRENMESPVGGLPCLRELLVAFRDEFLAKAAAFLSLPVIRPCIVVPNNQRRFLAQCLADPKVAECLDRLGKQETGHYEWVSPVGVHTTFEEFIAVRLPPWHGDGSASGEGIICVVDRMIRPSLKHLDPGTDVASIHYVVASWAARMVHRRAVLHWVCNRCMQSPGDAQRNHSLESLRVLTRSLRRTLSLSDIVTVTESFDAVKRARDCATHVQFSAGQTLEDGGGAAPGLPFGTAAESLVDVLDDWRHCAPPTWPPMCERLCTPDAGLRNLADWGWWRNCEGAAVAGHRTEVNEQLRHLLRHLWGPVRQLVKPDANLLPHGLRCYVFTQHGEPWIAKRLAFWKSEAPTCEELASAIGSIARVAHYVVGAMPLDQKTIEAMVWLLCEYAHHGLGVPGQIDLRSHLLHAARGEPALHVLRQYYRDHFFHALEVCFLGQFLLELKVTPKRQLWQLVADRLSAAGRTCDKQGVLRLWYVAALLHDVGYGIDVLKGVRSLLTFFENSQPLGDLPKRLTEIFNRLSKDLEAAGLPLYTGEDKPSEDHGVVAAWHLQKVLERTAEKDVKLDREEYAPAVRAIALHNSRKHTVRFVDDPLAFLLILCDTLQEWNRPSLDFATAPSHLLSRLLEQGPDCDRFSSPLDGFRVDVSRLRKGSGFRLKDYSRPLRFTLVFNERILWNAGVFNLWLDASCNLQRLSFGGLPRAFDVEIEYHTPLFRAKSGDLNEQQLHRLRDAASETHMAFLDRWFPQQRRRPGTSREMTNGAVTWRPGETTPGGLSSEVLRLRLRRLTKMQPIAGTIGEFRLQLTRWKRHNDDREFAGDYGAPEVVP